jgi:hypothetical protein
MRDFYIGDRVTFLDRAFYVRGLSPMSAPCRSIHLEDVETGERIKVWVDDLAAALQASSGRPDQAPGESEAD